MKDATKEKISRHCDISAINIIQLPKRQLQYRLKHLKTMQSVGRNIHARSPKTHRYHIETKFIIYASPREPRMLDHSKTEMKATPAHRSYTLVSVG